MLLAKISVIHLLLSSVSADEDCGCEAEYILPFCCDYVDDFSNDCYAECDGYNVSLSCVQGECEDELGAAAALFSGPLETAVESSSLNWPESPVYSESGNYVLFSDVTWADPDSGYTCGMLWKFDLATEELSEFLKCSGLVGPVGTDAVNGLPSDVALRLEAGSNGLSWAWDGDGTLLMNQHGWKRMVMLNVDDVVNGTIDPSLVTVVVDSYDGAALNSPNDVDLTDDGELFFTDPPFGLMYNTDSDAFYSSFGRMTQSETAVYRLADADAEPEKLLGFGAGTGIYAPNGVGVNEANGDLAVALSDFSIPYSRVNIYERQSDGSYAEEPKAVLYQNKSYEGMSLVLVDGLTFDAELGKLFVNGPGGVYIYDAPADGDYAFLGFVRLDELCANNGIGAGYLWITCANKGLLRVPLAVDEDEDESNAAIQLKKMGMLGLAVASSLAMALTA